jgi:hypothetical protein
VVRAIIEVLGAIFAYAPMSDSARGIRTRQIAFGFVIAMFIVAAWLALRQ